ncbi:hypothetical protein NM449_17820 (plasmid) [Vibrio metschnikovii]|uniref:hypothetical protein n=1 Tax=Vibrio metschnikovii TaxID=28172 RepID=UPI00315DFACD
MLKKRIDELCKELNTDAPYSSKSTEAQLNEMIDQLESQLPDDGDDNDRENSSKSLPNDAQLNQSGEGNGVSLSTEATVTQEIQNDNGKDDSSIMEKALASGDGFVLVQAQKPSSAFPMEYDEPSPPEPQLILIYRQQKTP